MSSKSLYLLDRIAGTEMATSLGRSRVQTMTDTSGERSSWAGTSTLFRSRPKQRQICAFPTGNDPSPRVGSCLRPVSALRFGRPDLKTDSVGWAIFILAAATCRPALSEPRHGTDKTHCFGPLQVRSCVRR